MKYRRLGEYTYPNLGIIRVFEQNQLYAEGAVWPIQRTVGPDGCFLDSVRTGGIALYQ